jgi:hypothetical protein
MLDFFLSPLTYANALLTWRVVVFNSLVTGAVRACLIIHILIESF